MIKKNIGKSLQIELVTKYDTKDDWKESLVGGSKSAKGGSISAGGPNPLWHGDDVSSYLKYYQLSSEILDYKLILFRSGHFDHNVEKM